MESSNRQRLDWQPLHATKLPRVAPQLGKTSETCKLKLNPATGKIDSGTKHVVCRLLCAGHASGCCSNAPRLILSVGCPLASPVPAALLPLPSLPLPPPPPPALYPATHTLRVPEVFHVGPMPNGRGSFIVMEALNMSGSCSMAELGRQLARMHLAEPAVRLQAASVGGPGFRGLRA